MQGKGKGYPSNVWASSGTPIEMVREQYRRMRTDEARANTSTDWFEVNVRACMPRTWRVGADGKAHGVQFATLDTLGDVVAQRLGTWLRTDLELVLDGDLFELDAVTITAKRTTTSYVEVRMDFPKGTTPWVTRQLIVASAYEVCRRAARFWLMDQLQDSIVQADAEVLRACVNLERHNAVSAEQRLVKARAEVTRLESLPEPLTGSWLGVTEALAYWKAREAQDTADTASMAAMIREYAARYEERWHKRYAERYLSN